MTKPKKPSVSAEIPAVFKPTEVKLQTATGKIIEAKVPSLTFNDPAIGIMNMQMMHDLVDDMRRAVNYLRALQNENHDAALAVAVTLNESLDLLGEEIGKVCLKELGNIKNREEEVR